MLKIVPRKTEFFISTVDMNILIQPQQQRRQLKNAFHLKCNEKLNFAIAFFICCCFTANGSSFEFQWRHICVNNKVINEIANATKRAKRNYVQKWELNVLTIRSNEELIAARYLA